MRRRGSSTSSAKSHETAAHRGRLGGSPLHPSLHLGNPGIGSGAALSGPDLVTQGSKHACVPLVDRVAFWAGTELPAAMAFRAVREHVERMLNHGMVLDRPMNTLIRRRFAGPPGIRSVPAIPRIESGKLPASLICVPPCPRLHPFIAKAMVGILCVMKVRPPSQELVAVTP